MTSPMPLATTQIPIAVPSQTHQAYPTPFNRCNLSWSVVSPSRRERQDISSQSPQYAIALQDIFFNHRKQWNAFYKLAKPIRSNCASRSSHTNIQAGVKINQKKSLSLLESLPTEILKSLFSDPFLSKTDAVALGLSSRVLWLQFIWHIELECRRTSAPWANAKIACVSDHCLDLPEPFERKEIKFALDETWRRIARYWYFRHLKKVDKFYGNDLAEYLRVISTEARSRRTRMHRALIAKLDEDTAALQNRLYPLDYQWVLRNLDTKEFIFCRLVRRARTTTKRKTVNGHPSPPPVCIVGECHQDPGAPQNWLHLDDALLMKICWSTDNTNVAPTSSVNEVRRKIYRGEWAGHKFDLATIDSQEIDWANWKDITAAVVQDALWLRNQLLTLSGRAANGWSFL